MKGRMALSTGMLSMVYPFSYIEVACGYLHCVPLSMTGGKSAHSSGSPCK